MKGKKKKLGILAVLGMVLCMASPMTVMAKSYPVNFKGKLYYVNGPKAVKTTGFKGRGSDVVAVAKSQLGYTGRILRVKVGKDHKRISYYGNVWNSKLNNMNATIPGNWCSEFASWCISMSGAKNFTPCGSVKEFCSVYAKKGRLYKFYASARKNGTNKSVSDRWFGKKENKAAGTMKLADLKPGDIVQVFYNQNRKGDDRVPHHTAIVRGVSGNKVLVYEGNKIPVVYSELFSPSVKFSDSFETAVDDISRVQSGSYEAHDVIAVIRPEYNGK